MSDEITRAAAADMLFVAAAGNSAANIDAAPTYPASYANASVIAVAATDESDALASFSNYGALSVHLGAPGVNVRSTTPNNTYSVFSGTSMATPYVSGAATLILSACALTTTQVKQAILSTVDPIPSLTSLTVAGGRLNVDRAIHTCAADNVPPMATLTSPKAVDPPSAAPATMTLEATASDSDGSVTRVDYFADANPTPIGSSASGPTYAATWSGVAAGTYSVTARATDNGFATATSDPVVVTVSPPDSTLPGPWAAQDIGAVGVAGSTTGTGTTFSMSGSGNDIWNAADAFQFVYQPLAGDGQISARLASLQNTDSWAKAGVMIRDTLTPTARYAALLVTPGNGLAFQRRLVTGGPSSYTPGAGAAPTWVKLVRAGTTLTAYRSADGLSWIPVGSDTVTLSTTVYVGLAVTSHNNGVAAAVAFDNVTVP